MFSLFEICPLFRRQLDLVNLLKNVVGLVRLEPGASRQKTGDWRVLETGEYTIFGIGGAFGALG